MATKKKPSAAQLAARAKFAAAARAGTLRKKSSRKNAAPKKRAANPAKKAAVKKNPIHPRAKSATRKVVHFDYLVQTGDSASGPWRVCAGFIISDDATEYAKALHKVMPGVHIRVVDNE